MEFPDKGAACPHLRLVYFDGEGELRRAGPRYLLKHFKSEHDGERILVKGYTLAGNKQMIKVERWIEITEINMDKSLHEELWSVLSS